MWESGFAQKEMAFNGQMQGYQWLHPNAIKRMYVVSQDN